MMKVWFNYYYDQNPSSDSSLKLVRLFHGTDDKNAPIRKIPFKLCKVMLNKWYNQPLKLN